MREELFNLNQELHSSQASVSENEIQNISKENVKNTALFYQQVYLPFFEKNHNSKKDDEVTYLENKEHLMKGFQKIFHFLFENLSIILQEISGKEKEYIKKSTMNNLNNLKTNFQLMKELFIENFALESFDEKDKLLLESIKEQIQKLDNLSNGG